MAGTKMIPGVSVAVLVASRFAAAARILLCSQQELRAVDERLRQRSQELQQSQERVCELEQALSAGGEQARARDLERDKASLEEEVDRLKQDALQSAGRISQLECALGSLTDEHDGLKHTHDVYKSKATSMMDEKDSHISDLTDRVRTLEKRLESAALTGDERVQSLVDERNELEKKLDESRQHLFEVKTSWSDKINNLESQSCDDRPPRVKTSAYLGEQVRKQILKLNQKMAEDSQEYSRMEKLLAEAQHQLKEREQHCIRLEDQLQAKDTRLAHLACDDHG
ncbi:uncharacterized protein LOC144157877 [Haemaphysalis longicornis]